MIDISVLRGYVLEELLAAVLKASGFDLLVDESQDRAVLRNASNGLCIKGRGADHQVDVLGELKYRVPYHYPIRLFVEAKYRKAATGLADVRNALGVINDVNEHYSTELARQPGVNYRRFDYRYALFSASGFTVNAQRFAVAQQISLIDLRGAAFVWLLDAAEQIASELRELAVAANLDRFPVDQARRALRQAFETWPEEVTSSADISDSKDVPRPTVAGDGQIEADSLDEDQLAGVAGQATGYVDRHLYLGFTEAPFFLLVQPDYDADLDARVTTESSPTATELRFGGSSPTDGEWVMVSDDNELALRAATSPELEALLLEQEGGAEVRHQRTLTIAVGERVAEVTFEPLPRRVIEPSDTGEEESAKRVTDYRRAAVLDESLAVPPGRSDSQPIWSEEAVFELLRRLQYEGWPQAEIIEYAAQNHGVVSRDVVYDIAGYPASRMLRSFTRPPVRIMHDLIREGILERDVKAPLKTKYERGVRGTHWVIPDEFTWYLVERDYEN